ncbi:MAG: hypothetical protein WAX85_00640 [Minisyncoccia bacterium]
MDTEVSKKIQEIEEKVDRVYIMTDKTRKYFMWTAIIFLVLVVIPLLVLMFFVPSSLWTYSNTIYLTTP